MAEQHYLEIGEIEVDFPDIAITSGVFTCIGVAMLNHSTKRGYLCHHYSFNDTTKRFIEKAVREAGKISDLEVALVGNMPLSEELARMSGIDYEISFEMEREESRLALEFVRSRGFKAEMVRNYLATNYVDNLSYEIIVDTGRSVIEVNEERL